MRIRLLITCEAPPPAIHHGQPTEFGLQDKRQALHSGISLPHGALRFNIPLAPISWEQIAAGQAGALAACMSATHSGTVALLGDGWAPSDDR